VPAKLEPFADPNSGGTGPAFDPNFDFVRGLIGARSPEGALAEAVRHCSKMTGRPAAGWAADHDPTRLSLTVVEGASATAARKLRKTMHTLSRAHRQAPIQVGAGQAFAVAVGAKGWAVADAGEAVVLVGDATWPGAPALEELGPLLGDVIRHLRVVETARKRNQDLDLGIALTAHEIQGPARAAAAAIDSALSRGVHEDEARELLARSLRELRTLGAAAESMLKWSAGREPIRRRPTNLVAVVREAIESSRAADSSSEVRMTAPARLTISADRIHLRTAVANVVRNALAFSPSGREVVVSVQRANGAASVIVEDRGPGVSDDEREGLFDPFVRGRRGPRGRNSSGLGLFIARQVVEAHRGAIWLEGSSVGARFHIDLPVH
jgi:signal transduction histidine kinase